VDIVPAKKLIVAVYLTANNVVVGSLSFM